MVLTFMEEWIRYLGHFHPLVVHLPIGILIVAFIMELLVWKNKQLASLNGAIVICLLTGCISAVLSCFMGWFLSREGGYEENTLFLHQWMGIGVAVLAGICWFIKRRHGLLVKANTFYRALIISLLLLLTITGHYGGNMTHGADYLTAGLPQPVAGWLGISQQRNTVMIKKNITDLPEAMVYADLVAPVLHEKCYSCHSARKIKGALRMDEEQLLFKGGKHGAIIQPGNADGSELIKRLLLPMEDDKRMPPKDQPSITKAETALLHWWISTGADTKKKVKDLAPDTSMMAVLHSFTGSRHAGSDTVTQIPLSKVFEATIPPASQAAIDELLKRGILVSPVAKNKQLLEISCVNYPAFNNKDAGLLARLADNIVWLRLDNTQITDEALTQIAQLKNLVRLNLAGTRISSAGLEKLKALTNLEYINLISTKADDAGLQALAGIPSLQQVYCWQSLITPNGIAVFKKNRPSVHLTGGAETGK